MYNYMTMIGKSNTEIKLYNVKYNIIQEDLLKIFKSHKNGLRI